jgi:hypothetical protein
MRNKLQKQLILVALAILPFACKFNQEDSSQARETKVDSQSLQKALSPQERFGLVKEKMRTAMEALRPTILGGRAQLNYIHSRMPLPNTGDAAKYNIDAGFPCNGNEYLKNAPAASELNSEKSKTCLAQLTKAARDSLTGLEWYVATTLDFARDLVEYLPRENVRLDFTSRPIVLPAGTAEADAKARVEQMLTDVFKILPSVHVAVMPTVHFHKASSAAVCFSHTLVISQINESQTVELAAAPIRDSNAPAGEARYVARQAYLRSTANGTPDPFKGFLRQEFAASVFASRYMAHSRLGFTPIFSAVPDMDALMDNEVKLGCEGATGECLVHRGSDVENPESCPIITIQ